MPPVDMDQKLQEARVIADQLLFSEKMWMVFTGLFLTILLPPNSVL